MTSKINKASKPETKFTNAPEGRFHRILIRDDSDNFSIHLFIENIRQYEGGYVKWMIDNRDLFDENNSDDYKAWELRPEPPSEKRRDIFSGIRSSADDKLRSNRWEKFRKEFTFENLLLKSRCESDVKERKKLLEISINQTEGAVPAEEEDLGSMDLSETEDGEGPTTSYYALLMKEKVRLQAQEIQRLRSSSVGSSSPHSKNKSTLLLSTPSVTWNTIQDGGANLREFKRFIESSRSVAGTRLRDTDISKEMLSIIGDTLNAYATVAGGPQGNPVDAEFYKGWEQHSD